MTASFLLRLPPPPLAPALLGRGLSAFLKGATQRHPGVLARMGSHAQTDFLLDVTDAPLLLLMSPARGEVRVYRRGRPPAHGAGIRGSLSAFLAMLHGVEDGDALFFEGALSISGDTSAVLALRNALDDAEIDLTEELAAHGGPVVRWISGWLSRRSGLVLSRRDG